jgi:hypothetical protein
VSTTEELLDRKVAAPVLKTENTAVGIRYADLVAPSIRKSWQSLSPTSGGHTVGIVRSRTQTMECFTSPLWVHNAEREINWMLDNQERNTSDIMFFGHEK